MRPLPCKRSRLRQRPQREDRSRDAARHGRRGRRSSTRSASAGDRRPATKDKYFGFLPGNGIHDIHMNQGNVGQFMQDDGVYQDGGLLIHFPDQQEWVAAFLKFQSQAWHTDDTTGHPHLRRRRCRRRGRTPHPTADDRGSARAGADRRRARELGAVARGRNVVTLLNTAPQTISARRLGAPRYAEEAAAALAAARAPARRAS